MIHSNNIKTRNIIINLVVILLAIIMCLGGECCLSHGYGLGDIIYQIPLMIITGLYVLLLFGDRKTAFNTLVPPIIFTCILVVYILTLIFDRGGECPCSLFE